MPTSEESDLSSYGGMPVILYDFVRTSFPIYSDPVSTWWRYTSGDRDYLVGGDLNYVATAISDDGYRQTGDTTSDQMTIVMPADEAVPLMFAGPPPSDPIYLSVWRTHYGELDRWTVWTGQIGSVTISEDGVTASIVCNAISATLDRNGLRLAYVRGCPYNLYGPGCNLNPYDFGIQDHATAVEGAFIHAALIAGTPDQSLVGGFVEWLSAGGHAERRGIIGQSGDAIATLGAIGPTLAVGDYVGLFPGCAHTPDACDGFNNLPNYGGHPYMVNKSPFSGDIIF